MGGRAGANAPHRTHSESDVPWLRQGTSLSENDLRRYVAYLKLSSFLFVNT